MEEPERVGRDHLEALVEERDDGASEFERDELCWFLVAETLKTIMASLSPVTDQRACCRNGPSRQSLTAVKQSPGFVHD